LASAKPDAVVFIPAIGRRRGRAAADGLSPGWCIKLVALGSKLLSIFDSDAWATISVLLQSYRLRAGLPQARVGSADFVDLILKNGY
jgi:hypothetical protein